MTWAVKQKAGNATGKAILLMLANYANAEGECFPSHDKIAEDCECNRRSVIRWLFVLEQMGLLKRTSRRRSDGTRTSDTIVLLLSDTVSPSEDIKVTLSPTQSDNLSEKMDTKSQQEPVIEPITEPVTNTRSKSADEEWFDSAIRYDFPRGRSSPRPPALKAWLRLSKADKIACADGVLTYSLKFDARLAASGKPIKDLLQFEPHLATWINQRRWELETEE